ncbi:hypothetical protein L2719_01805 [Shewanella schlegeliana]|uniref:Uncharacterized protein n=1 Tax=Shewanella schlegeliana TaxID=190308 RepID=A0ABS1SXY0_9GAMM|nr:hypothetical protein [Shewanella schlegeliana]MBL4913410.1 hypothetical protein [Shewanella schlegeliana]MCL1108300.1 hypothetical protein [Shewanella schlegeliana]
MALIFLPLLLVLFKYRDFERLEWLFTGLFLAYGVALMGAEVPPSSRLGGLYLAVPSISYFFYLFPEIQTQYSISVIRVLSMLGVCTAFIALIVFFN